MAISNLFQVFLTKLSNDNNNSFIVYVLQNDKVVFMLEKYFDDFYVENDIDKYGFFKNCQYLYLFKNNKNSFKKIEMKLIFDCFFGKDGSIPKNEVELKLDPL